MKKIVGVTPLWDDQLQSVWMLSDYTKALEACGLVPVILPLTADPEAARRALDCCDGLLVTGGQDVDPARYGEAVLPQCGALAPVRDALDTVLVREAAARDLPTFGICRGAQIMNAALGGTLWQDLPTQAPSDIVHRQERPYDRPVHPVSVMKGTPLADILGPGSHSANSLHHQAIHRVAEPLEIAAEAPDGIVEAVYLPGKRFFLGAQWHPEFLFDTDADSRRLFEAFAAAL